MYLSAHPPIFVDPMVHVYICYTYRLLLRVSTHPPILGCEFQMPMGSYLGHCHSVCDWLSRLRLAVPAGSGDEVEQQWKPQVEYLGHRAFAELRLVYWGSQGYMGLISL